MNIILPVVIFVSWLAFAVAPAGKLAIEDEQNKVREDKRRGNSILPGWPLFPLVVWGVAIAVDHLIPPWGAGTFLGLHVVLLAVSVWIIVRDILRLRKLRAR
jgi:hypothetical protein